MSIVVDWDVKPQTNKYLQHTDYTKFLFFFSQEKIRLKYKLTYSMNDQNFSDVGDVEGFPLHSW